MSSVTTPCAQERQLLGKCFECISLLARVGLSDPRCDYCVELVCAKASVSNSNEQRYEVAQEHFARKTRTSYYEICCVCLKTQVVASKPFHEKEHVCVLYCSSSRTHDGKVGPLLVRSFF